MSYAYPRITGSTSLPSFTVDPASRSSNTAEQTWDRVALATKQWVAEGVSNLRSSRPRNTREAKGTAKLVLRRLLSVTNAVILMWFFTLRWGERTVFQENINACAWEAWEAWV